MTTNITKSVLLNFDIIPVVPFLNNPKDLDPSYKTDLDFWDFSEGINPSYNRKNTVFLFLQLCNKKKKAQKSDSSRGS